MHLCLMTLCQRFAIILQALRFVFSLATLSCRNRSLDQQYQGLFLGVVKGSFLPISFEIPTSALRNFSPFSIISIP